MSVCDYFPAIVAQRTIPVGDTLVVDGVFVSNYRAAKWLVTVANADFSRVKTYEVYATHRNGISPTLVTYAFLGDTTVTIDTSVSIVTGKLNLDVTNSDVETLTVYVTRLQVPITNVIESIEGHVALKKLNTVVRAGQTGLIDFIPIADVDLLAAKWIITITANSNQRLTTQVFAHLTPTVQGNEYSLVGDRSLQHDIILTEVAGHGIELSLHNTSAVDYAIDATCVPVRTVGSLITCTPSPADPKMWHPQSVTIPAGATRVADVVNTQIATGVKWLTGTIEETTNRTMGVELGATTTSLTLVDHTMYAIIADHLNIEMQTTFVAGCITLEITNNEANAVTVNLLRVPTAL